jgi:hypothetical protein
MRFTLGNEVDPAIPPRDVAQLEARLADRGRVDNRHHLGQVVPEKPVEQHLVPVQQALEEDVLLHVVGLAPVVVERALHLQVERRDAGAQEAGEFE